MNQAKGTIYHVKSEMDLAAKLYQVPEDRQFLLGELVKEVGEGNPQRFRDKFEIEGDFILYAGRKISGKNLPLLVDYFHRYKQKKLSNDLIIIPQETGLLNNHLLLRIT